MKARIFLYKWNFLWISYILEIDNSHETTLYADNLKFIELKDKTKISYFSLSLSRKSAFKKLEKFAEKRYKEV